MPGKMAIFTVTMSIRTSGRREGEIMEYKGYEIDITTFLGIVTVLYAGDEVVFDRVEEAKRFIDDLVAREETKDV